MVMVSRWRVNIKGNDSKQLYLSKLITCHNYILSEKQSTEQLFYYLLIIDYLIALWSVALNYVDAIYC